MQWASAPAGTQSFVVHMHDMDVTRNKTSDDQVHWVVWNIDPKTREIKENSVPPGAKLGGNDFRKNSYGGPCPPSGVHRYFFRLYALDTVLGLGPDATKAALQTAANQRFAFRFSSADYQLRVQADNILPELTVSEVLAYHLGETELAIDSEFELDIREAPLRELLV